MKKKTTFSIILITLVAVTSIFVGRTYARYISTATASGEVQVAKWEIDLSGQPLTGEGAVNTATLTLNPIANAHIASGKIAPNGRSVGVLSINPENTEVSVEYSVALQDEITLPTGVSLVVKSCTGTTETCDASDPDAANWVAMHPSSGVYTNKIELGGAAKLLATNTVNLLIIADWPNDELRNATDTATGVAAATLTLPFDVTVKQYIPVEP